MKYPIVVLDLDGTLLHSDKRISERNYKAIMACAERGVRFIFATARPPRAVRLFLQDELLGLGSFIYYNGAYIRCPLTGVHLRETIEPKITADILDYCLSVHPDLDLSLEANDEWISIREYDEATLMRVKGKPVVKPLQELRTTEAAKILFTGKIDLAAFRNKFESVVHILVTDEGHLVQISSIRASKEQALIALCKEMGNTPDQVMVFGDDYNDLGLFRICGWPVAMGNAIEELKALAKEVTDTNDRDGVARVLEKVYDDSGKRWSR